MSAPQTHIETLPRSIQLVLLLGLVALAAFPFVGSDFYLAMVNRMMILAIFAMSLDPVSYTHLTLPTICSV